ncbi:hypothetical protein TELCIR_00883 [Teladorsagia circumcincta]|uniref:Uncharacterized protein n=1 Tax=Teladorsagia circumcincta TaxID=45464 RepID=A0A2G9V3G1_TELCI|nr:hypothetical protein TELCIR_00883 [Teladorsagia circumcincta]
MTARFGTAPSEHVLGISLKIPFNKQWPDQAMDVDQAEPEEDRSQLEMSQPDRGRPLVLPDLPHSQIKLTQISGSSDCAGPALGLKFLVRITPDLGMLEANGKEYVEKLGKAERVRQLKMQRESDNSQGKRHNAQYPTACRHLKEAQGHLHGHCNGHIRSRYEQKSRVDPIGNGQTEFHDFRAGYPRVPTRQDGREKMTIDTEHDVTNCLNKMMTGEVESEH